MQKGNHSQPAAKRRGRPPKPEGAKGPRYLSFNEQELERLRQLGFRERWAYVELKGVSNWKEGTCGLHLNQCLTYAQITTMVTAPGLQGRGQGNIDDKTAADILQRLEQVGLVANIGRRANRGLMFDMPFSPIQSQQAAPSGEIEQQTSGKIPTISPDQVAPQTPENPAQAKGCDDSPPSLSVMINKELNNSNDGADSAVAETAPCRVSDAAPARENLVAPPPMAGPRLSPVEIQQTIEDDWTFSETGTPQSLALFKSWADAGITRDDLHAAMNSLDQASDSPDHIPANLTAKLWPKVVDGWFDQLAD